jgi:transposase
MKHIAIDLGGRESQICSRDANGAVVEETRQRTDSLKHYLSRVKGKARVVIETCAEGFAVADIARELGHEVRVVPGSMVRALGVGARGTKTDKKDAQVLSEVSCRIDLPSVHIPSKKARERKTMSGLREGLVEARTKLINNVRGWLRTKTQRVRGGAPETFVERVREIEESRKTIAKEELIPKYVERTLKAIEALNQQIKEADKEIEEIAEQDEVCRRLMTMPGVGPVTAVRFAAALDEVERFKNAHAVESYLGLVPGEYSSSDRRRLTSITKAGSTKLRWALVQAAWVAWRWRSNDPMVQWAQAVGLRRGRRVAVIALARKMAGILYAMWRDQTNYQARQGAIRVAVLEAITK